MTALGGACRLWEGMGSAAFPAPKAFGQLVLQKCYCLIASLNTSNDAILIEIWCLMLSWIQSDMLRTRRNPLGTASVAHVWNRQRGREGLQRPLPFLGKVLGAEGRKTRFAWAGLN